MRQRKRLITTDEKERTHEIERNSVEVGTRTRKVLTFKRCVFRLSTVARVVGLFLFGHGFYLAQTQLFTSEECSMTYSYRKFLHLELGNETIEDDNPLPYKLYKFYDQRDPLHTQFHALDRQPYKSKKWCLNDTDTTAVLYVPGHGGSYAQSRSLGAHGIQLGGQHEPRQYVNKVRRNLVDRKWRGNAEKVEDFVYSVYALDFAEEGGGLHGIFLEDQAAFLRDAVEYLSTNCGYPKVIVLAHSIGGISSRLALSRYGSLQEIVTNMVLLGSPQSHSVLSIDPSIRAIFAEIGRSFSSATATVSISGGLRDELVPPSACELVANDIASDNFLSVASVDIMDPGDLLAPSLGMDHRAIVWCHNLLTPVRSLIFAMDSSDRNGIDVSGRLDHARKILKLADDYRFQSSVERMVKTLPASYGAYKAAVVEIGLLYNSEFIVSAFFLVASFHYITGGATPFVLAPIIAAFLGSIFCHNQKSLRPFSFLVLSIVAETLHRVLLFCLCFLMTTTGSKTFRQSSVIVTATKWWMGCFTVTFLLGQGCNRWLNSRVSLSLAIDTAGLLAVIPILVCLGRTQCNRQPNQPDDSDAFVLRSSLLGAFYVPTILVMGVGEAYHSALRGGPGVEQPIMRVLALATLARVLLGPSVSSSGIVVTFVQLCFFLVYCAGVARSAAGLFLEEFHGRSFGVFPIICAIDCVLGLIFSSGAGAS